MSKSRAEQILDYAEREIRRSGFDGVSFRDIADAIGIKSASVHYHFPTKADLGADVTRRYAENFLANLGLPDDPADDTAVRVARLADAYLEAYRIGSSNCLCAVLGSVVDHLPEKTSDEVRKFYDELRSWLDAALAENAKRLAPNVVIGLLQGAMVLSMVGRDESPLVEAKDHLVSLVA